MRGNRESLAYRESVLRALNRPKNAAKGPWKGMTPEEAYRGLLEEVLELGEELFRPNEVFLRVLREALREAFDVPCKLNLDPQRVQEEYDDVGGAHLILGDVVGCLDPMISDVTGGSERENGRLRELVVSDAYLERLEKQNARLGVQLETANRAQEQRIEELEAERKRLERVASAAVQYRLMQIDLRKAEMEGLVVFGKGRYQCIGQFGAELLERRREVMREFRKAVDALEG